ncbi:Flagellar assembly factor FliW [bioreactor metagenome]|uniref:Flagellar assembly factor FliW n=1 Tax=bioreactor metagenome TaxID=1076179 RepID=A0A645DVY0_9ZZZZ
MIIETRDFGKMNISEDGILTFKLPILGFESQTRFVILYDDELGDALGWLQSIDDRDVCFIIVDPHTVFDNYAPIVAPTVLGKLGLTSQDDAVFRSLVVIPTQTGGTTINLKSPLVINPAKKLAAQVVLDQDYAVRTPLNSTGEGLIC